MVESLSERTKSNTTSQQQRYFVISSLMESCSPQQWLNLIRGHWAGVEIRNHWKKDACLREDQTRSKNPRIVANLILLRNGLLKLLYDFAQDSQSLPETVENLRRQPSLAMKLVFKKLAVPL